MEPTPDVAATLLRELAKAEKLKTALRQIVNLTGVNKGKRSAAIARKALNAKNTWE